jgi:hypothetical protein
VADDHPQVGEIELPVIIGVRRVQAVEARPMLVEVVLQHLDIADRHRPIAVHIPAQEVRAIERAAPGQH